MAGPFPDRLTLVDDRQRRLGQMTVEQTDADLLSEAFAPGPDYAVVEPRFREFEAAVNGQALAVVDRLDAAIAALGLRLQSPDRSQDFAVADVQIWSDGGMSCRRCGAASGAAKGAAATPAAKSVQPW